MPNEHGRSPLYTIKEPCPRFGRHEHLLNFKPLQPPGRMGCGRGFMFMVDSHVSELSYFGQ
jgi:hypothetical protein